MRRLSVFLEVCILMGLKTLAHINQMRIIDRCTKPGVDVPVLHHALLKEGDIHYLPDKRA